MRALTIPLMLLSLALAGCGTTGGLPTPPPVMPSQVSDVIAEVQAGVSTACSIAVTAGSISGVLSAIGVPYVGMVSDIVSQLCGAFNRPGASRGKNGAIRSVVVVDGRPIVVRGVRQ